MREGGMKCVHFVVLLNDFRSSVIIAVPIRRSRQEGTVIVISCVLEKSLWLLLLLSRVRQC